MKEREQMDKDAVLALWSTVDEHIIPEKFLQPKVTVDECFSVLRGAFAAIPPQHQAICSRFAAVVKSCEPELRHWLEEFYYPSYSSVEMPRYRVILCMYLKRLAVGRMMPGMCTNVPAARDAINNKLDVWMLTCNRLGQMMNMVVMGEKNGEA